ncbi:MAG: recombinase RecT [Achromobacter sp.]|uniref:recombinase RecT n=1 Tax=Achromobacter sp. TaxID=134375 RepID=UPI003CFC987D
MTQQQSSSIGDLQKTGEPTKNPLAAFSHFMDRFKPQLALALPKHLTPDRMARLTLTAFSSSPQLQNCDHRSIAASIMTAGQLGLEPGVNGQGFLVPYGRTCTFVPGWKGLVDLVARSGRGTVFTGVIFRDQDYTFTDGARRDLVIHNETDLDAPEDITHAYAIGWVRDAAMPIIELWRVSKIQKHRDKYNKVGRKHYSYRDWEMYARKVPLLQVIKYMPCSIEVANALAVSHAAEAGRGVNIEQGIVIDMDTGRPVEEVDQETGEVMQQPAGSAGRSTRTTQSDTSSAKAQAEAGDLAQGAAAATPASQAQQADQQGADAGLDPAKVEHQILNAKSLDVLDLAADSIDGVADLGERSRLHQVYQERRLAMTRPQQPAQQDLQSQQEVQAQQRPAGTTRRRMAAPE